jgi:hypothetical protein
MKTNTTKKQDACRQACEGHNESTQVIKNAPIKSFTFEKWFDRYMIPLDPFGVRIGAEGWK